MVLLYVKTYGLLVHTRFRGLFSLVNITVNLFTEQISQLMNSELVNVFETPKCIRVLQIIKTLDSD